MRLGLLLLDRVNKLPPCQFSTKKSMAANESLLFKKNCQF